MDLVSGAAEQFPDRGGNQGRGCGVVQSARQTSIGGDQIGVGRMVHQVSHRRVGLINPTVGCPIESRGRSDLFWRAGDAQDLGVEISAVFGETLGVVPFRVHADEEDLHFGQFLLGQGFEGGSEKGQIRLNAACGRLTGLKDVLGKRLSEVIPGVWESAPELLEACGRVASTGKTERFEIYVKPLALWFAISVYSPTKDYFVAVFDDITARKTAEAEREKLVEALRETDWRKNEFMAMLSHELRNPLAPIKNSLFVLDHAAAGGSQARRAQAVIARQVDQLARLVDDLLDVTRIARNKIQLQRQRLELSEHVRRTMEDYRSLFEKKDIRLDFAPAPHPLSVNADGNRLAQVVGNLLDNAATFTDQGGSVSVSISSDAVARQAVIRFADTGIGMTREVLSRLFQPFTQADKTLARSRGGLGLGLALVKGIVELHGGEVTANSAGLGKGSELIVRLPLELPQVAEPQPGRASPERIRRRVLIIEDNIDAADSLREALELDENEVAVAYNGPEGIAKAREFAPAVVLCDIGLPGMDGYEVARTFRSDDSLRGTCLVALSGYALPEDVLRAQEAGFERHIAKPPRVEELEELLGGGCRRHSR